MIYYVVLCSDLTADGTPFRFGKDADGNYGYIVTDEAGADSVIPFKKGNANVYKIYSKDLSGVSQGYTYTGNIKVDVKAVLPDLYDKLTESNFIVDWKHLWLSSRNVADYKFDRTLSYDNDNGILTYSQGFYVSGGGYFTVTKYDIYVIVNL